MKHTVKSALLTGTAISCAGIFLLYLTLPSGIFEIKPHCLFNGFVRRYDGGCTGWTTQLAMFHVITDLMHWWAYVTASVIILQLHPIMAKVPSSKTAVYLMVAFIFGCGTTHLFEAYTTFNPIYVISGWFKLINGIISCVGAYFIAKALVRAFAEIAVYRKRLDAIDKEKK